MRNTEFYEAVKLKSHEHSIDLEFLYIAVLCLKNNLQATTEDICREFIKRGESFYPGVSDGKAPAGPEILRTVAVETMFLKGIHYYLLPTEPILQYHASAYLKLTSVLPLIALSFSEKIGSSNASVIIKALCIDLILPINYERPGAN